MDVIACNYFLILKLVAKPQAVQVPRLVPPVAPVQMVPTAVQVLAPRVVVAAQQGSSLAPQEMHIPDDAPLVLQVEPPAVQIRPMPDRVQHSSPFAPQAPPSTTTHAPAVQTPPVLVPQEALSLTSGRFSG